MLSMDEFDNFLNSEGIVLNDKELKRFMKKIDKNNDQVFIQLIIVITGHCLNDVNVRVE